MNTGIFNHISLGLNVSTNGSPLLNIRNAYPVYLLGGGGCFLGDMLFRKAVAVSSYGQKEHEFTAPLVVPYPVCVSHGLWDF